MADFQPKTGDFVQQTLVTDTVVYEVVKTTAATMTIRRCADGEVVRREDNGSPYPVVYTEQVPWEDARTQVVRRRKDGTFRVGDSRHSLRPARMVEGVPARRVDYSW